jgi:DNA sulfur modification protein DndD
LTLILDELVLHNFGVYRGRHTFTLTPESKEKPIVLIGAQNGAGKTTFLEGLQLGLFGRLALANLRGSFGYDDYLRHSINRSAPASEGAEVQVSFRRAFSGREQVYTIRRIWSVQKGRVREIFEAVVDGKLDRVLTAQWGEFVEEMMPPRIAPLFFFDGEKIEDFADLERSSKIVSTAVGSLLGLDIVERLQLDLTVLERRKASASGAPHTRADLATAQADIDAAAVALKSEQEKAGTARTGRDRALALAERARAALKAEGGDLFTAREALTSELARLDEDFDQAQKHLRGWAAENAPLLLVPDLLRDVAAQSDREAQTEATRAVLAHLGARDQRTLEELRRIGADEKLLAHARASSRPIRSSLRPSLRRSCICVFHRRPELIWEN